MDIHPGDERGGPLGIVRGKGLQFFEQRLKSRIARELHGGQENEAVREIFLRKIIELPRQPQRFLGIEMAQSIFGQITRGIAAQGGLALQLDQRFLSLNAHGIISRSQPERREPHRVILVRGFDPLRFAQLLFHLDAVVLRESDVGQKRVVFRRRLRAFRQTADRQLRDGAILKAHAVARQSDEIGRRGRAEFHHAAAPLQRRT